MLMGMRHHHLLTQLVPSMVPACTCSRPRSLGLHHHSISQHGICLSKSRLSQMNRAQAAGEDLGMKVSVSTGSNGLSMSHGLYIGLMMPHRGRLMGVRVQWAEGRAAYVLLLACCHCWRRRRKGRYWYWRCHY